MALAYSSSFQSFSCFRILVCCPGRRPDKLAYLGNVQHCAQTFFVKWQEQPWPVTWAVAFDQLSAFTRGKTTLICPTYMEYVRPINHLRTLFHIISHTLKPLLPRDADIPWHRRTTMQRPSRSDSRTNSTQAIARLVHH